MNTTFKPSEFDKQAAASIDMLDVDTAQERVAAILGKQAGPTLTPAPQTPTQAPATPNRKPRSDKGIPKRPPADPDEIVLRLTIEEAQRYATNLRSEDPAMSAAIFNQIIAQIKKRLDSLTRSK